MKQTFNHPHSFTMESGKVLEGYHLAYTTLGQLNAAKDNVVWVFHALTASSDPVDWWPGLVGENTFFDPAEYFIVCVNMPGSCYGSISPLDKSNATGEVFYHDFPMFTTRDMIRAYQPLKEHLGIDRIKVGIGGSMGGQQLLEWAIEEPELFEYIIPIATNAQHSSWGVAFNASQRMCIENDPTWIQRNAGAGLQGMKTARSIALLSYRHYDAYAATQRGFTDTTIGNPVDAQVFKAETYQAYQGEKLVKRFNAFSYWYLGKAMDTHNLGRGRESVVHALQQIKAKALIIGISSDVLFPPCEQEFLAKHIPNAELAIIDSSYGHDGFLLEYDAITQLLNNFFHNELWFTSSKFKIQSLN